MMSGLDGKVVAITGASSGIGEAAAKLLAASGAKVVLGARRADRPRSGLPPRSKKQKARSRFSRSTSTRREDLVRLVGKARSASAVSMC